MTSKLTSARVVSGLFDVTPAETGPDSCWVFPCGLCNGLAVDAPGDLCQVCTAKAAIRSRKPRARNTAARTKSGGV